MGTKELDMEFGKLIQKAIMAENIDKKELAELIASSLENKESKHDAFVKLYDYIYGDTLCRDKCEEWVDAMVSGNEHGQKWSIEEIESLAKRLEIDFSDFTKYEFYAVVHMMNYDYKDAVASIGASLDAAGCAKLALAWFNDEDAPGGKTKNYYFHVVCGE